MAVGNKAPQRGKVDGFVQVVVECKLFRAHRRLLVAAAGDGNDEGFSRCFTRSSSATFKSSIPGNPLFKKITSKATSLAKCRAAGPSLEVWISWPCRVRKDARVRAAIDLGFRRTAWPGSHPEGDGRRLGPIQPSKIPRKKSLLTRAARQDRQSAAWRKSSVAASPPPPAREFPM